MVELFRSKRYSTVFAGVFVVISMAQLLKGHAPNQALKDAAIWGAVAVCVLTWARIWPLQRGKHCAICQDAPELQQPAGHRGAISFLKDIH